MAVNYSRLKSWASSPNDRDMEISIYFLENYMFLLRARFERWLLPKVVHYYWWFGIWIWHRLVIHYDIDRDRASDLIRSIDAVDLDLTLLLIDIRTGKLPCHTPGVTSMLADYFQSSENPDLETVDAIHTALDQERGAR